MSDTDDLEHRVKRLRIRSWRRGTREMDMILGPFFDREGSGMSAQEIDLYEEMLEENDQDLYVWVSGRADAPPRFEPLIARLRS